MLERKKILEIKKDKLNFIQHKNPSPEDLAKMARDESDLDIRMAITQHASTLPKTLVAMTEDTRKGYIAVRHSVAKNPNISNKFRAKLARDKDWIVRAGVAENPNSTKNLRRKLAKDEHWHVRSVIAKTEQSPFVLTRFAKDNDLSVRITVSENQNTPPKIRERIQVEIASKVIESRWEDDIQTLSKTTDNIRFMRDR